MLLRQVTVGYSHYFGQKWVGYSSNEARASRFPRAKSGIKKRLVSEDIKLCPEPLQTLIRVSFARTLSLPLSNYGFDGKITFAESGHSFI